MILAMMLAQAIPAGTTFKCTPTRVWDGDGPIWCAEGPRVRLAGIAAREMDGTCSTGHPCPAASAEAARDGLVRLVGKPTGRSREGHVLVRGLPLTCHSTGSARRGSVGAWCLTSRGTDLSCAIIRSGLAKKLEAVLGAENMWAAIIEFLGRLVCAPILLKNSSLKSC